MGAILAGLAAGVLSGWGVGGGTLLLVYLTVFAGVESAAARGINLLYFLPCALPAVLRYTRTGLLRGRLWLPGAIGGCAGALAGVLLGGYLDTQWLQQGFGVLLLLTGLRELRAGK